jgi:feruloyl esterase
MTRQVATGAALATLLACLAPRPALTAATACAALAARVVPGARSTHAELIGANTFRPPAPAGRDDDDATSSPEHRSFCRVGAVLAPSADSAIGVEVWLPAEGWNGRFQGVGNGAFGGSINYGAMLDALRRGYAVAATDTGHTGGGASFAYGHPEKLTDFAWRAVHEMTVWAKSHVIAHYDRAPRWSYWNGCSSGGRQGLKEAQQFPADYDGIVAGDPGHDWIARASQAVKMLQRTEAAGHRLLANDRRLLHDAVVKACDGADGLVDGLIADPRRCRFDPGTLQCRAAGDTGCLSAAQVDTARQAYTPMHNATTHREIGAQVFGSELGWTDRGWTTSAQNTGRDQFRFIVFENPEWNAAQFAGDADVARAETKDAGLIDARGTSLQPFFTRGGKLIQYHGWSDPQISPLNSVAYYDTVVAALGATVVDESYRLFMAPGMGHCRGGEGPNSFDSLSALEAWVEHGTAPASIVASRVTDGAVTRTRPLCPYPQQAVYAGRGSIDHAASFSCR